MFNLKAVERLRGAILSEKAGNALDISTYQLRHRVWILLMFELWARQYVDIA